MEIGKQKSVILNDILYDEVYQTIIRLVNDELSPEWEFDEDE